MIKDLLILTFIFILIDFIYLKLMTKHFKILIFNIQKKEMTLELQPTVLCYIILVFSLYYFIIKDNKDHIDGAILGWVIYFVYDLTNYAILDGWDLKTVIYDGLWGGILYGSVTYLFYKVKSLL
jgi:uncharacterized membrane protein